MQILKRLSSKDKMTKAGSHKSMQIDITSVYLNDVAGREELKIDTNSPFAENVIAHSKGREDSISGSGTGGFFGRGDSISSFSGFFNYSQTNYRNSEKGLTLPGDSIKSSGGMAHNSPPSSSEFENIPALDPSTLRVGFLNPTRCGGLLKKLATRGILSKGALQERYFYIELAIPYNQNYYLDYAYTECDDSPRQSFPLDGASVLAMTPGGLTLQFVTGEGQFMVLEANSSLMRDRWADMLEIAIAVAKKRGEFLRQTREI